MKRTSLFALAVAAILLVPMFASAQVTSSGTLAVTATVASSISMVFASNGAGVALGGAGTNAATLAFGNIGAYGALSAGVGRSVGATTFTVSSPFNVLVDKSNSSSANYSLTAQLASADAVNTWALNATTNSAGDLRGGKQAVRRPEGAESKPWLRFVQLPRGAPVRDLGAGQGALDLGSVSYLGGAVAEGVSVTRRARHLVISTVFGVT